MLAKQIECGRVWTQRRCEVCIHRRNTMDSQSDVVVLLVEGTVKSQFRSALPTVSYPQATPHNLCSCRCNELCQVV